MKVKIKFEFGLSLALTRSVRRETRTSCTWLSRVRADLGGRVNWMASHPSETRKSGRGGGGDRILQLHFYSLGCLFVSPQASSKVVLS